MGRHNSTNHEVSIVFDSLTRFACRIDLVFLNVTIFIANIQGSRVLVINQKWNVIIRTLTPSKLACFLIFDIFKNQFRCICSIHPDDVLGVVQHNKLIIVVYTKSTWRRLDRFDWCVLMVLHNWLDAESFDSRGIFCVPFWLRKGVVGDVRIKKKWVQNTYTLIC